MNLNFVFHDWLGHSVVLVPTTVSSSESALVSRFPSVRFGSYAEHVKLFSLGSFGPNKTDDNSLSLLLSLEYSYIRLLWLWLWLLVNHTRSSESKERGNTIMVAFKKSFFLKAVLLLALCLASNIFVLADENQASPPPKEEENSNSEGAAADGNPKVESRAARPLAKEVPLDTFDVKSHFDWGTYYDPKNVFCGKFDCYGILGFDYESFDREKPTQKQITKRYRALSRHWHPDKSKHPEAKERFQVRSFHQNKQLLSNFQPRLLCYSSQANSIQEINWNQKTSLVGSWSW